MNKGKKHFFSLVTLLTIAITAFAQQVGTNSPYGRYGYGQLSNPSIGASDAMGGISYGLRRSQNVNPGNPASYSELDTLTFIFDIGISGHYATYNDGVNSQNFYNGNLDYVAMQFPLFKNVGASVGLLPYSKVGYTYGRTQTTTDLQYDEIYNGSGGLSQIYAGLAYEPFKYLSLGVNVGYMFGNILYNRQLPDLLRSNLDKVAIRNLKYDLGIQLTYPLSREKSITLGAVYTPKVSTDGTIYSYDRISDVQGNTVQVLKSDTTTQAFEFPNSFGLGVSYSSDNLVVGIDGTYQLWKGTEYPSYLDGMELDDRFNNRYKINAGAEYTINPLSRNFFQRIRFRGGLSYSNSYNNVNVYNPTGSGSYEGLGGFKEYGLNVGLGLPFRDSFSGRVSMLNLGFGYSILNPDRNFMIKEEMFKITVGMNINEFWFFKRQFD